MKKMINKAHVEGRIFESTLEVKVSKAGVTYIGGKLQVATDEECLNVIPVEFTYVVPTYKSGAENKSYAVLEQIIDTGKTVMTHGKEEATMVRIDPAIGLNEWYKDENGTDVLVSTKRNEGGFIHIVNALNADEGKRSTFEADMVITGTVMLDGDEEKGTQDKLLVKGCIFNFANRLMPVEFSVLNPNGIKYFENLDATPNTPVFTKVWGRQVNETIITKVVEESAFGDSQVRETKRERKDWVITGTSTVQYEFDTEGVLTAQELKEAMSAREIHLAEMLQKTKEYKAAKDNKNNAFSAGATKAPAAGGFNF